MYSFPLGVLLESFNTDYNTALEKAAALKLTGVQVYATRGELSPENLSAQKRKELLSSVNGYGMKISALCGDLGQGFGNPDLNPKLIEQSKLILNLAADLETNIVTTHIGVIPAKKSHPRYSVMQRACAELAEYADKMNAHFAIETGPEIANTLKEFLESLGSTGVAVNLDPANFVMVTGDDPAKAVHTLKDYIVHTHAKDGKKLLDRDPEVIYGIIEEAIQTGEAFIETPLGQGDVDFGAYLTALDEIGYRGFLTIEREVFDDPEGDIRIAAEYLRTFLK